MVLVVEDFGAFLRPFRVGVSLESNLILLVFDEPICCSTVRFSLPRTSPPSAITDIPGEYNLVFRMSEKTVLSTAKGSFKNDPKTEEDDLCSLRDKLRGTKAA